MLHRSSLGIMTGFVLMGVSVLPTVAQIETPPTLPNGGQFFMQPPQLVSSLTTFKGVSVPAAKYYFTLAIPAGANSPLGQVVFQQLQNFDSIDFYPDKTHVFFGDRHNRAGDITTFNTEWDASTNKVTVTFTQPIPPGKTITIQLKPTRNPDYPGIYQFRVYATPTGANSQKMDLGLARFQFYRDLL